MTFSSLVAAAMISEQLTLLQLEPVDRSSISEEASEKLNMHSLYRNL